MEDFVVVKTHEPRTHGSRHVRELIETLLIVDVDVTYDGSLRTNHAHVELRRSGRD